MMNRLFRRAARRRQSCSPILALEALEPRLVLSAASVMVQPQVVLAAPDQVFAAGAVAPTVQKVAIPAEVKALLSSGEIEALRAARTAVRDAKARLVTKKAEHAVARTARQKASADFAAAKSAHQTAKSTHATAKANATAARESFEKLQGDIGRSKRRQARFEKDASNLVKSGLISRWIRKYGENSREVAAARSALQQQLDGAAAAKNQTKALQSKLPAARARKQKANANVAATKVTMGSRKTAKTAARTAKANAASAAQAAAKAVEKCRTELANARLAEQKAEATALRQAGTRAQQYVERHAAVLNAFEAASDTFRRKLSEVDDRRSSVSGLAGWFAVMGEVAGELDGNPDPTQSLKIGSDLLHAAGRFLFPGLNQLAKNAQGEAEAGKAGDIQLWEAIDAGNRLNRYAKELDGAQRNLEKVHAAEAFLMAGEK